MTDPRKNSLNSLNSLDPDHPDFDLEEWAEAQWENWPDIGSDLQFGYDTMGTLGEFDYCIAYFAYWKFKIDMTLEPEKPKFYPVELTINLEEGDFDG